MDTQAQLDLLLNQATADMPRRVKSVSSLVMRRLMRSAPVPEPDKPALTNYFSVSSCQLQQLLNTHGSPGDVAQHCDNLYTASCGKLCHPVVWLYATRKSYAAA